MPKSFPQNFGKYILLRKIATGGMAEIFQAKTAGAEGFEKDIVIKRILPHFSEDDAFVKMFIDEASITAKLQHANIVQIFDFDVIAGSYYIAMEYIEGEDLSGVMKDGNEAGTPLSVAQCVWITMQLAKGLHYAHVKEHKGRPLNIIHRDISPHNAMVAYSGEVKLMDFGIAKAAERSTKTQAGTVKGKVAYMSPEQARGRDLDGRSDLFALATVLWEMLTNKRCFMRVSDFETLTAVLKEEADPPSRHRPDIDQELDDIILTALEKDPAHRQKNVEEFDRELTRWYYKNVSDLEGEKLKPFMHELYAAKIRKLRGITGPPPEPQTQVSARRRGTGRGASSPEPEPIEGTAQLPSVEPRSKKRRGSHAKGLRRSTSQARRRSSPAMREHLDTGASEGDAPTLDPSQLDHTVEASAEEILSLARRRGSGAEQRAPSQPPAASAPTPSASAAADFFSSPETMTDENAPSQEEVLRALNDERRRKASLSAPPWDARSAPPASAPKEKSMLPLVILLAVIFLGLGGLIAFLVAPK